MLSHGAWIEESQGGHLSGQCPSLGGFQGVEFTEDPNVTQALKGSLVLVRLHECGYL